MSVSVQLYNQRGMSTNIKRHVCFAACQNPIDKLVLEYLLLFCSRLFVLFHVRFHVFFFNAARPDIYMCACLHASWLPVCHGSQYCYIGPLDIGATLNMLWNGRFTGLAAHTASLVMTHSATRQKNPSTG